MDQGAFSGTNVTSQSSQCSKESEVDRGKYLESLGLLLSTVAHDLNNILSGIIFHTEYLIKQSTQNSTFKADLEVIKTSTLHAAALVSDLLTLSRGQRIEMKSESLYDIVAKFLLSSEFFLLKSNHPLILFSQFLDPSCKRILGSEVQIKTILMNLVTNAAESIIDQGTVYIRIYTCFLEKPLQSMEVIPSGTYTVCSIEDDGKGIEEKELFKIFEPFYSTKHLSRGGTGLGLTIVWNIVKSHSGYIHVYLKEKGTIFELYFPAL